MAGMTLYVDHIEIEKGISRIKTLIENNSTTESKIGTSLDDLKNSITINGKHISNKREIVDTSMKNFNNSLNTSIAVLNHVVDIYFASKDHSVAMIRNEVSKL